MDKCLLLPSNQAAMATTKETFRSLIREGQELLRDVEVYDRPLHLEENGRYVLVGVRQSGKSYMLYERAKQLLKEGHTIEEFVYIDFEDERLIEMTPNDFDLILQTYRVIYPYKPILLLDEIQNVEGWEHFARRLANQKHLVYITGSNAKMLSREIHTTLGGRYNDERVYPYSFAEFLGSQGVSLHSEWSYGTERFQVEKAFKDYLRWGGFPELLLFRNKRRWLNGIYEKILLNDILVRNKIKNEKALRMTVKRIAESVTKPIAFNRIANLIKSVGVNTTTSSVSQYVDFAQDAYVILSLENYASKSVERETIKKYYFIDNGLLSIFLSDTVAPLLENVCAVHLHRKYGEELYYYYKKVEVDFYIPGERYAIQVCTELNEGETKDREVNALLKLDKLETLNRMLIVTLDEETSIVLPNGKTVEAVPAWKWLLADEEEDPLLRHSLL